MKITKKDIGLFLGPLVFSLLFFWTDLPGLSESGRAVLAVTSWVAIWWITEALDIEVTALLPIILLPLTGGLDLVRTCAAYGHKYIFLFVGGFILAIAIEKWKLHKRIALRVIDLVGTNLKNIILGFMLSSAFLSMWLSNTATTVMMLPIGLAIVKQVKYKDKKMGKYFGRALMLSIAYAASIGGMATLIGTPPNLILAGMIEQIYGYELTFSKWLILGLPICIVLLFLCWYYLTHIAFHLNKQKSILDKSHVRNELKALGKLSKVEKRVLFVFVFTALAWVSRSFFLNRFIPSIDDTIIAILAAFLLFLIPSGEKKKKIIGWKDAVKLPWGILMLFGGGIALAAAFQDSGLALWIAGHLKAFSSVHLFILLIVLVTSVNFLTEITSNIATASVLLPILASLALAIHVHPYGLMVACTLAASCAFMLPVATPPNAIVFGSGYLKISHMIRAGFRMNVISIIIITLVVYFILPLLWNMDIAKFPVDLL